MGMGAGRGERETEAGVVERGGRGGKGRCRARRAVLSWECSWDEAVMMACPFLPRSLAVRQTPCFLYWVAEADGEAQRRTGIARTQTGLS
jgi:hypothetical protein